VNATTSEAGDDRLAFGDVLCIFYQQAAIIVHQGVAAVQDSEGGEGGEVPSESLLAIAGNAEMLALGTQEADIEGVEVLSTNTPEIALSPCEPGQEVGETLATDCGPGDDILAQQARGDHLELVRNASVMSTPMRLQAEGEVVHTLLAAAKLVALADENGLDANAAERIGGLHEPIARGAEEALIGGLNAVGDVVQRGGDELGGCGRRGRPEIGDKIGDGEVGFVADGGDDGQFGVEDHFGEEFGIEGSEVFKRSAATRDNNEVDLAGAVEVRDAGGDLSGSGFALDNGRVEQDVEAGMAAVDDVEEVANDSAGRRGDDPDAVRECREGFLVGGIEEAASSEALLELFEGDLQRAGADWLQEFGNELHLAALFVNGDFAAEQDVEAVGRFEAEERRLLAEKDGGKLCVAVFEREVDVAGGRGTQVGDFSFDPEVAVFAFNVKANFAYEFADFPDVTGDGCRHRLEGEAKLMAGFRRVRRRAHNC